MEKKRALQFVLLLGLVSLLADVTYEGARSITGPFLATLGATGAIVGTVAGLGEFIGYAFRLVSGYWSDKTGKYWALTIVGYAINLAAVPLLAFADNWPIAVALMIAERFGKALRVPPRDAMLSFATKELGRGWGFGIHEAMDQIGAILGPLLMAWALWYNGSYPISFGLLGIPVLLALLTLFIAAYTYPHPETSEKVSPKLDQNGFSSSFWLYTFGLALIGAGYVDFPLIAYHFKQQQILSDHTTPLLYAIAMGVAGLSSLILGKLYDNKGLVVVIGATFIPAFFSPLVFLGRPSLAILGMVLWGIGMGSQESIMRAHVANLVSSKKRATAYGFFNFVFGLFWFLGSALMGFLYDTSIMALLLFSILTQLASLPLLLSSRK